MENNENDMNAGNVEAIQINDPPLEEEDLEPIVIHLIYNPYKNTIETLSHDENMINKFQ